MARASRAKIVTLDEVVLLPGPDALLAPEWVPWSERLRPGDMGPGDLLPTDAEDLRLEPGYSGEDEPAAELRPSRTRWPTWSRPRTPRSPPAPPPNPRRPPRGSIAAVAEELGMRRARVLSRYGLHVAADRWEEAYGAKTRDGPGGPRLLRQLRLPGPDRRLAGPGLRRLRERVLPGGRPRGVPAVRLRRPLRGGGHAEAARGRLRR